MTKLKYLLVAMAALGCASAQAQSSINLGSYAVTGNYQLDTLFGTSGQGVSGLEASGVAYSRDTGNLYYVGDEGTGVVEISKTGQTLSTMRLTYPTGIKGDAEGITYLGNNQFAVVDERAQDIYKITYAGNTNVTQANASSYNLTNAPWVNIGPNVGNDGLEGLSYDRRDGSFVTIKQDVPENVRAGRLTFATGSSGGTSTLAPLFDPALLGVSTLSDVQTLSPIDRLAGTGAADNLLILSLGSHKLLEVNRSGQILSSFDLSGVDPHNAIEGVTVDQFGTIYLVGEQAQDGSEVDPHSVLVVLSSTAPVPEPETYGLMLAGLGMLAFVAKRKKKSA
ncbi:MAG: hypothetical protein JWN73_3214 [Betaproteobacteria bacterium]|nr:hypothetical protein [Betaproteobacteria bacterium]